MLENSCSLEEKKESYTLEEKERKHSSLQANKTINETFPMKSIYIII